MTELLVHSSVTTMRSAMKNVNAVTMVMNVWLIVSEQETQEIQRALETEVNAEQLQLQQQLQQANETIAKLLDQRKPTSQSLSELFSISYDNELYVLMFEDFPMYHSFISPLKSSPVAAALCFIPSLWSCLTGCRAMLCIIGACAVMWCVCVCPSRSWIMSKRISISSKFFHHQVATPF